MLISIFNHTKELLGVITILLSIVGHFPYILDTIKGKTKPHIFTWVIWSIVTLLAFFGQWAKGGGAGSWGTGITGLIAVCIAILSLKKGTKDITTLDKVFFFGALIAIIPWYLTKDPTTSIIIATLIDACAFIPTIRKTIKSPKSETFATYSINIFRHTLSLVALGQYNLATVLYPAYLLLMNSIITTVMLKAWLLETHKTKLVS